MSQQKGEKEHTRSFHLRRHDWQYLMHKTVVGKIYSFHLYECVDNWVEECDIA